MTTLILALLLSSLSPQKLDFRMEKPKVELSDIFKKPLVIAPEKPRAMIIDAYPLFRKDYDFQQHYWPTYLPPLPKKEYYIEIKLP